jgi:hypothetical protein
MAYQQYTDEQRAGFILMMEAAGFPDTPGASRRVSERSGIHRRTLERWARRAVAPVPEKVLISQRRNMAEILENLLFKMAGAMDGAIEDAPLNQLAVAYGITFDKLRLMRGESTDNNALKIQVVYDPDTQALLTASAPGPNGRHNGRDEV